MLELSPLRKNKVSLRDYNCEMDLRNRTLLADFSIFDVEVLEEILYSPLKISLKKLTRQFISDEPRLLSLLKKLAEAEMLTLHGDLITIDKDMRKYFEFQLMRFDPDFKPDLEFIQGLLRKVPIHILPTWYAIPRTSNNIFESIVEKYLLTPHVFQRYIEELHFSHPAISSIIQDVFQAPDFTLSSTDLIAQYNLTRREFDEILLLLEFHFICCLCYRKEGDHWLEVVTPFHEWHQHLRFLKETEAPPIESDQAVIRTHKSDFAFIEEMTEVLQSIRKKGKALNLIPHQKVVEKLQLVRLASSDGKQLVAWEGATEWLEMSLENKALYLYRHPLNRLLDAPSQLLVREAEKGIKRALHGKWIYIDDFIQGSLVSLSEHSVVMLKKVGKHWKYNLPIYTDGEKALIHATMCEWLFEVGMVAVGKSLRNGEMCDCFCVTPFGRFLFEE